MEKIKVVDSICGSGKTKSIIKYINNCSDKNKKFLYITPLLSETERIIQECKDKDFKTPLEKPCKIFGLKYLLQNKYNIVSTHSLFKSIDKEILNLDLLKDYTLIMDESLEAINVSDITSFDLKTLLDNYVKINDDGSLYWYEKDYKGKLETYKKQCELRMLFAPKNRNNNFSIVWMMPKEILESFQEIFILTYNFDKQIQKAYYDYNGFNYNFFHLDEDNNFVEGYNCNLKKYKNLITICNNNKMNEIGNELNSLSFSWYLKGNDLTRMKNNCSNFFKHIAKTPSSENMWTTYKEYVKNVKGKGYSKGFLSSNIKGTNSFIDKKSVAYLINKYSNPMLKNFLLDREIEIDEDGFAFSEMIQFLFRSCIRKGEEINLYIPSKRMRNILLDRDF